MAALRKPAPCRLSVSEFLAWDSGDRSGRLWQLRDGVPEAMAPASETQGAIQSELSALLRNHLLGSGRRCRVSTTPGVVPRVRSADNARVPDLAVTRPSPSRDRLMAEPVLLIEILSPSNADETWANVWAYTTMPSVTEILVVSSTAIGAELLRRLPDGSWPEAPQSLGPTATLELASIGFQLPIASLGRTTALL